MTERVSHLGIADDRRGQLYDWLGGIFAQPLTA